MPNAPSILLIEDDILSGELVDFILTQSGYKVTWVRDGKEGMALIEAAEVPHGLVITELLLPYVDGWRLLSRLRESSVWRLTPVVFLTDSDDESDIVSAFELGANDFIGKPFRPVELTARVRHLLDMAGVATPS